MKRGVNRISRKSHVPRDRTPGTGESTRAYIVQEGSTPLREVSTPIKESVQVRYYAVLLPKMEGDVVGGKEIGGPEAKIELPGGRYGYFIIAKEAFTREDGEFILKARPEPLMTLYVGKEYKKTELDFRAVKLKAQLAELNLTIHTVDKLRAAMKKNNLERMVEVEGGAKIGITDARVKVVSQY